MKTRTITGVGAAALLTWLLYAGPLDLIVVAVLACAAMVYVEFDHLFFGKGAGFRLRQLRLLTLIAIQIIAMRRGAPASWVTFWIAIVFLCIWNVIKSDRQNDFAKSVRDFSLEVVGYVYVVGLFGFLVPILEGTSAGRHCLFLFLLLVFMGDTVAYFAGSRWGKHRLVPNISPKKSVEGAVASLLSSLLTAAFWLQFIYGAEILSPFGLKVLLFAPLVSILAQLGDLFESMLKRSQTQKDSGSFLPGHGGMLDRVDGFLLAAPIFYFYLIFFLEELP